MPRSEIDLLEVSDRSILEKNPMTRCEVERRNELSTVSELVLDDREGDGRGLSILDNSLSSIMGSRRDVESRSQLVVVDMIELSATRFGGASLLWAKLVSWKEGWDMDISSMSPAGPLAHDGPSRSGVRA